MLNTDLVEVPRIAPKLTSTFEIVSQRPLALDMTTINHAEQSTMHTKAIFRLEAGTLMYCIGAPGQPRPHMFATAAGDANTLVVLRRRTEPTPLEDAWRAGSVGDRSAVAGGFGGR